MFYLRLHCFLFFFCRYPSQKEWQRKEQLYLKIIDYFENDKQWEHAIPLCKGAAFWREIVLQNFFDICRSWLTSELKILELFSVEHNQTPEFGWLEMVNRFEFQNFSAQNWHFKLTHYFLNQNVTTDCYWICAFFTSNCCRNNFMFKMCKSNNNLWNIMV